MYVCIYNLVNLESSTKKEEFRDGMKFKEFLKVVEL